MAVIISSEEEKVESLKSIADAVAVAMETIGLVPDMWFGNLEKKRSRPLDPGPEQEGRTNRMRNVGTVALSNVTSQISRMNPIGKLMRNDKEVPVRFTDLQKEEDRTEDTKFHSLNAHDNLHPEITVTDLNLTTPRPLNRTRKISKSSEDVSKNPIDNVLIPFAKLTQGLQTLGSNLDQQLSRSCEQFIGAEAGSPVRQPEFRSTTPRRAVHAQYTNIDERVRRGQTVCNSLILNI